MGVYSNVNMKSMVQNIQEAKAFKLWLGIYIFNKGYNARPEILIEISTINFPNLKELSLGINSIIAAHNQIHSIEALQYLNLPKLQELQFSNVCFIFRIKCNNDIETIKKVTSSTTESRIVLYSLNFISDRNFTNELSPFTSIHSKNLKTIWL